MVQNGRLVYIINRGHGLTGLARRPHTQPWPVGFTLIGEHPWAIHYSFYSLGTLDDRTWIITSARHWPQPDHPQAI